jgi:hypothetical protein
MRGGATLVGVSLMIGMRVSRSGLMRGLPTETDIKIDALRAGC